MKTREVAWCRGLWAQVARSCPAAWLRRQDQPAVAVWLVIAACGIASCWISRGGLTGGLVWIDRVPPIEYRVGIDINQADWPELTLLPGIGRTMARRIVQDRRERGPFRATEDLQRVPGMGAKTVAQLRPYLKLDATEAGPSGETAGAESRPAQGGPP